MPPASSPHPLAEDQLPVVAAADVRFDRQVGEAVGGVEAHELEESVHLHAAAGERLELHQPVLRVAVQDQRRVSRGRGVARHDAHGTVGHHGDLLQQGAQHLHAAAAPRQAQEGQARFRSYRPVHPQGVVHQHALGPAGDGQHAGRRIAAQQRRLHPQVALDLLRGGDGAAAREGPGGRRGAHEELGEVRRGGVEGPVRPDGDVLLQPDAAGGEAGQQRAVFGAKGRGGVPDLQVRRGALQQGRLDEARGRERVDGEVRRGGHARGVLQGGDPAVDGRDRAAERVECGHQGVAAVALGLAPAVRLDLDDAAVAQDRPSGEGRPEEQAADELGRELLLDEVEEATAGFLGKYLASSGAKLLLLRYRPSASALV